MGEPCQGGIIFTSGGTQESGGGLPRKGWGSVSRTQRASRKTNRRKAILRAAESLILAHGLSGVTTRQISRQAGCSEGALYVHFNGRLELLLAMLEETLPTMLVPLEVLRESVGSGSPQENLVRALGGIFKFHQRIVSGS